VSGGRQAQGALPPAHTNNYARRMANEMDLLINIPLFAGVPKRDLQHFAKAAHDMKFEPGARLTSEDEMGVTFFVVLEGEADVFVSGQSRRRLGPGDYFGEMSIIDRSPRSAEVVAVSALRCLVFTQWEFRPFLKEHPDVAWALLEALVRRLREVERALQAPGA
jgi:CRP-like cAMP-binding protein